MSDIIREVDEELRRERLQKLWERYGIYVVSAALLIVFGVAGWRGWEWYASREAAKAGARFETALELAEGNKRAEADELLAALTKDAPAGYGLLARFRAAAELAQHDKAAGSAAYDALANDPSVEPTLRDLAKVRAALALVDSASPAEIASRLEPLIAANSPFRPSAREILGLARFRAGEAEAARKMFAEVLTDPETPPAMRSRAQLMLALLSGGEPAPATQ
jgi:hypothetical protein